MTDGPITITLIPIKNIQTVGSPVVIASIANFGNIATGSINYTLPSLLSAGAPIKYAWKLETGGISITDTITKIYQPTVVFSDDMETAGNFATKWVKSSRQAKWAYEAGSGFGGTASLTESPSSNYSNSDDQSVSMATSFSLASASDAYLSFMVKYQSENCQDRLQVEISTSGVSGTYTPICTENTIVENRGALGGNPALTGSTDGYVREIVNLKNYVGNTNMSLRFHFMSSASTRAAYNTNGFNIDNLKIVKTNVTVLPVRFEDLTVMRVHETIVLHWKAQPDEQFAYYEVQRSGNGRDFTTLDGINDKQVSTYTDKNPLTGSNYYRIKAVDVNGKAQFSKTVLIIFAVDNPVTVYPNPVTDYVMVAMNSEKAQAVQIELISLDGTLIMHRPFNLKNGWNTARINLPLHNWTLYIVRVKDASGMIIKEQKILKTQ